jgi:hypothetical protein
MFAASSIFRETAMKSMAGCGLAAPRRNESTCQIRAAAKATKVNKKAVDHLCRNARCIEPF